MNPSVREAPPEAVALQSAPATVMAAGFEHHRAKRLEQAQACYEAVLRAQPMHAEALHHLGLVRHQQGRSQEAVDLIRQAIQRDGTNPRFFFNLRTILNAMGRAQEAEEAYRQVPPSVPRAADDCYTIAKRLQQANQAKEAKHYLRMALLENPHHLAARYDLGVLLGAEQRFKEALECFDAVLADQPEHPEALSKRGLALMYLGDVAAARGCFERALALQPRCVDAHLGLGEWLQRAGRHRKALEPLRTALEQQPGNAQVRFMLANSLAACGMLTEAEAQFRQARAGHPHPAMVLNNLADVLFRQNRIPEAGQICREALRLNPDLAEVHANLANVLAAAGQTRRAEQSYRRALELNAQAAAVHNNLGGVLLKQLRFDDARACFARALELQPAFVEAHSNLLYLLTYQEAESPAAMLKAHAEFGRRQCDGQPRPAAYGNVPDPARRLKVGFVSPDLRAHPVATFIEALFRNHDPRACEYFCYSDVMRPDAITARLKGQVEQWREICGMSHEEAAELIQRDGIDILVDLAGHTGNHRLLLFARKPAPVQVSYIGYLNTSGLAAMDYWLTDGWVNPPESQLYHTEKLWPLARCFVCYTPDEDAPPVSPLPAVANGAVTFGVLNNACKVQPAGVAMWCELLHTLPTARLLFKSLQFTEPDTCERFLAQFAERGIEKSRITLLGPSPKREYLQDIARVDIGLDTFPDNGNTVTHDTLWMGVPVVSLKGDSCVSRVGHSILTHLGHPEWVAHSAREYVSIAAGLARDLPRLQQVRAGLRQELARSPLMDGADLARHVDAAWRGMWQAWCGQQRSNAQSP
ncbi:MAG: tetratricopeptide repeat protein [SAR324 cluster bacterium]